MVDERSHLFKISVRPIKAVLLIFLLFFYLYGVNFTFLPVHTSRIILFVAIIFFAIKFLINPRIKIGNGALLVFLLYILYFNWVLLLSGVQELRDVSILANALLLFVHTFIGGMFFATLFQKLDIPLRDVIFYIQIVIFIQAVFIIIYFISWDFKEFTFKYIPETGNIDHRETLYRSRGLTHSSGATLSVLQSIGLLFTAYLISTVNYRTKQFYYLILSFGVLIISIALTGRTGLLMLPVALFYLVFLLFVKKGIPKNIFYFIFSIPVIIVGSYFLFRYGYYAFVGEGDAAVFDRLIRWYTKEFFTEGQVQSRTVRALFDHWFLPEDTKTFLFGDPSTWNVNRIRSDVGFIRRLHGTGFLGLMLIYSLFIAIFIYIVIKCKKIKEKSLFIILGLFLFLIEFKEPMFSHISISGIYLMIFSYLILKKSLIQYGK